MQKSACTRWFRAQSPKKRRTQKISDDVWAVVMIMTLIFPDDYHAAADDDDDDDNDSDSVDVDVDC